jgi:hypothetical protein
MWMRPSSLVPLTVTSPRGLTTSKRAAGGEGKVEGLVALMLVAEELVERVGVDIPAAEERVGWAVEAGSARR